MSKREIQMIKNMSEDTAQMNEKLADLARHTTKKSEFKDVIKEITDKKLKERLIEERKRNN